MCISEIDGSTFWTMVTALATITLVIVGSEQLSKIRSTNSTSILIHLEDEWNDKMRVKRKNLASKLSNPEIKKIEYDGLSNLSKSIEDVLDYFEKIATLTNKKEFNLDDVYQLYSHYIQNYWEIILKIGYIEYVRNEENGHDFYDQTEKLYDKMFTRYDLKKFSAKELVSFLLDEKELV